MSKLLVALFATSFGLAAGFVAGPRILYSGLQAQIPFGTAVKVAPDPSNIWHWHHAFAPRSVQEVFVDFDKNGRMDTENRCFRVVITDMQVSFFPGGSGGGAFNKVFVHLEDDQGLLWDLTPPPVGGRWPNHSIHLSTPIVVPIDSKLRVRFLGIGVTVARPMHVILIGRLLSM